MNRILKGIRLLTLLTLLFNAFAARGQESPALPGVAGEAKYRAWTHHIGGSEQAVVSVQISATDAAGNKVTRIGGGFVLRCDGFVLIPESLAPRGDTDFRARLSFVTADGEPLTGPLEPIAPPRFRHRKAEFVTLKINDHHFPCLPALNPAQIRPGMSVRVVWATPLPDKSGHAKTLARRAIIGDKIGKEERYGLRWAEEKPTGELLPEPIVGAIVTDEKGKAILGILTAPPTPGTPLSFATLAHLAYISNEVGLYPTLKDVPQAADGDAPAPGGMATIPGGPVRVTGELATFYARFYKTNIVCTPPFLIDKREVTVGEYRAHLRQFPAPRLPQRWDAPSEKEKDIRPADLPAVGMLYEDAAAFAAAQEKRLPTPVEWFKASQGADTIWFERLVGEIHSTAEALSGVYQAKLALYNAEKSRLFDKRNTAAVKAAIALFVDTPAMQELNRQQIEIQRRFFTDHWYPFQNAPVGFYRADISASGVLDVITNAPEMVAPNYAAGPGAMAQKPFAWPGDGYLSYVERITSAQQINTKSQINPAEVSSGLEISLIGVLNPAAIVHMDGVFATFCGPVGAFSGIVYFDGKGAAPGGLRIISITAPGFRCVK